MLQTIQLYLTLGLLCLVLSPVLSQNFAGKELVFDKLDKSDGLINDRYNDFIYKDSRGYLWVSSMQGVYQYDGYDFRFFTSNVNDEEGMIGTNVQSEFYEDEEKNIWFSTYQGINKYDVEEDKIFGYTISDDSGNTINSQYYIFHLDTLYQELWAMVDKKIYKYNYVKKEVVESIGPKMQSIRMSVVLDEAGKVTKIYGAPWHLDSGIEILYYEDDTWKYKKQNLDPGLDGVSVCGFVLAKDFVWLISNRGLIKYSDKNGLEEVFTLEKEKGSQFTRAVLFGTDQILILSKSNGLCVFDLINEQFSPIPTQVQGLENSHLHSLYIDQDNILWVDINIGGIGRVDLKADPLFDNSGKFYEINNLKKVCSKDEIYLLSSDNNFVILDTTMSHKVLYKVQLDKPMEDVIMTSKGELFFIDRNTLYSYDTKSHKFIEKAKVNFDLIGIREFQNQIFFLSFKGICKWDTESKTIVPLKYINDAYNQEAILVDALFMGDNEYLVNYHSREFHFADIHDYTIKVRKKSPINSYIYDAVCHNEKWYFVSVNGLFQLDRNGKQNKLSYQSYLPELGFNSIVFIGDEILLGNSEGLYTYSTKDSILHQVNNLLDKNLSVIPQGIEYLANGNILVACQDAIYELNENKLKYKDISPELKLQSVEINNRVNKEPNILNSILSEIELNHNVDFFALELKSINKRLEVNGDVKYKDSRINQWQSLANGKLSLENLTPGNFELSFVALDEKLNASSIKKLKVIVKEPFYKSKIFLLSAFLMLGLISYGSGIMLGKIKSDKRQRELLLQLAKEQERNRIASMIHDDMGATLSTIQFASEDLSMDIEDLDLKKKADAIQNDAKDLISRMRSNIWVLNDETKSVKDLGRELRKSALDQIGPLKLQLEFPQSESLPDLTLSGRTCMEVLLIQKESLNNIVKHAQAKKILITNTFEDQRFVMQISDDGIGFPDDNTLGMGTTNMNKRTKAINGKLDIINSRSGVTIKLTVPVGISNKSY